MVRSVGVVTISSLLSILTAFIKALYKPLLGPYAAHLKPHLHGLQKFGTSPDVPKYASSDDCCRVYAESTHIAVKSFNRHAASI